MRYRTFLAGVAAAALVGFAPEALALMPPHIDSTVPAHGGTLEGDTVLLRGYSLEYAELDELKVESVATGLALAATTDLDCRWEGHDPPGHVGGTQQRCELRVTLQGMEPGQRYRLSFLDTEIEFEVKPASSAPQEPAPPAAPIDE